MNPESRRIFEPLWFLVWQEPGIRSLRLSPRWRLTTSAFEIPAGLRLFFFFFVCICFAVFYEPGVQLPPCGRGLSRLGDLTRLQGACVLQLVPVFSTQHDWGNPPARETASEAAVRPIVR